LGLKVIGIDYPNHIATAVLCKTNIKGDRVRYKDNEFIICDPTYINASAGMSMPNHSVNSIEKILDIK